MAAHIYLHVRPQRAQLLCCACTCRTHAAASRAFRAPCGSRPAPKACCARCAAQGEGAEDEDDFEDEEYEDGSAPAGGYAARRAKQAQRAAKRAKREGESGDALGDELASDSDDDDEEGGSSEGGWGRGGGRGGVWHFWGATGLGRGGAAPGRVGQVKRVVQGIKCAGLHACPWRVLHQRELLL